MELDDKSRLADQWLDAAIKQYAPLEPDSSLPERVMRRIPAGSERQSSWRWWPALAAATAATLVMIGLLISKGPHRHDQIAQAHGTKREDMPVPIRDPETLRAGASPNQAASHRRPSHLDPTKNLPGPQWPDHFPSPQPLNDQEQMLALYVSQFHRDAVLLARAQTTFLANEEAERETNSISNPHNQEELHENN